jgi:transposase-like protein
VLLPEVRGRRGTSSAGWISIRWSPSCQGDLGKRCRGRLRRLEALADFPSPARPADRSPPAAPTRVCDIVGCCVHSVAMSTCPSCHCPATKRDGCDASGRQRYYCRPCHRDFTAHFTSAFSGYRWPPDVILMAVRGYCSLPLSAAQVVRLLAESNIVNFRRSSLTREFERRRYAIVKDLVSLTRVVKFSLPVECSGDRA